MIDDVYKERLLYYRDHFWKLMITESMGEEAFKTIDAHIKKRLLGNHPLEFAVFDTYEGKLKASKDPS